MRPLGVGAGALLRMSGGAIVWVSAFVALYLGYSLGCQTLDIAEDAGRVNSVVLILLAIALAHATAMAWLTARWLWRPVRAQPAEPDESRVFRHRVEGLVLGTSSVALALLVFPILMVKTCVA